MSLNQVSKMKIVIVDSLGIPPRRSAHQEKSSVHLGWSMKYERISGRVLSMAVDILCRSIERNEKNQEEYWETGNTVFLMIEESSSKDFENIPKRDKCMERVSKIAWSHFLTYVAIHGIDYTIKGASEDDFFKELAGTLIKFAEFTSRFNSDISKDFNCSKLY